MISSAFYFFLLSLLSSAISTSSAIDEDFKSDLTFQNGRLQSAYVALQAWKKAIISDRKKITANWVGPNVCSYTGVFCAPAPDDLISTAVAGIDLIAADLTGSLPTELNLLSDLALIHLNSNQFSGIIPTTFTQLKRLFELDLSNNLFSTPFPSVLLELTSLKFLDLRYNAFSGPIPAKLFELPLEAIFLNNNRFDSKLPDNIGHSKASLIVLANNSLSGCVPSSIGDMKASLNEILLNHNQLGGCLPPEIGQLEEAVVVDVSGNKFSGKFVPETGLLGKVEEIDVSENMMVGEVPEWVCGLRSLKRFSVDANFFEGIGRSCEEARKRGVVVDDRGNCLPDAANQRAGRECKEVTSRSVDCNVGLCGDGGHRKFPATTAQFRQPCAISPAHKPNEQARYVGVLRPDKPNKSGPEPNRSDTMSKSGGLINRGREGVHMR